MKTNIIAPAVDTAEAIRKATVIVERVGIPRLIPCSYTYTLTGEPAAVREKVESLMRDYPPMGYRTRVTYTATGAIVNRSASCD